MENKATEIIQQLHMLSQIIYKEYFKIRKPASLMTNNPTSLCFLFSLNIRYEPSREMKSQWTAVWVKISSSWIGIVLYVWTLVAPLVLTNRDFDWMGLEAWKSHFDHHLFEVSNISNFCEVVCVCASRVTSPVFWHELDLPLAILFTIVLPSASICVLEWIKSCMSILVVS